MKKILLIAAAALISASVFAQTVTSANIVGYNKTDFTAGQIKIVAPQFLTTNDTGIALGDAFGNVPDQTSAYTWDGSSYKKYIYFAAAPGWFDPIFTPSDSLLIEQGDAVWLEIPSVTNVIVSGEVPTQGSITNNLVAGINLIANPYPVELTLGDIPTNSISDQDNTYIWDGSSYKKYTYFAAGPGWFDPIFTPSGTNTIAVGQGFWLESSAGGDLILDKQY